MYNVNILTVFVVPNLSLKIPNEYNLNILLQVKNQDLSKVQKKPVSVYSN